MSSELDRVRAEVAHEHGLDVRAASFLTGSTVEELEASAAGLARLVGCSDPAPIAPLDLVARSMADKQHRKQALHRLFTGRSPQPRDSAGRFVLRGSFDGGARAAVPAPPPTGEQALMAHGQWLAQVIAHRRGDQGIHF